jgi:tetratricopeptide (TPR) repeat protein
MSLYQRGEFDRGVLLAKKALEIAESTVGPDHPTVATSLNNLASFYRARNQYAEAEPLLGRALAIREKTLGPEHLDVARALHDLAEFYHAKGEYHQAAPLVERALVIEALATAEKMFGPEHPDVAGNLQYLAGLLHAKGQYAHAEALCRRALAIWEKTLGPKHPHVVLLRHNLAVIDRAKRQAEPLAGRALAYVRRLATTLRLWPARLLYEMSSNRYGVRLHALSDGRYGTIGTVGDVTPLMVGSRYALVEKPLATYLRALNVSGISFRPAVIWDQRMDLEHHSHEQMIVDPCSMWDLIGDPGGKRILTMDDGLLLVSPELKEELENSSFKYLWFTATDRADRMFDLFTQLFGRFKKPSALTAAVSDLADTLSRIRASVDELARSAGIGRVPHYDAEASAFVYVLGWYAIQELDFPDERRLSAELAGAFAKKMASESSGEVQMLRLLEDRVDFYRNALKRGQGPDRMARLIIQFMHFLGHDPEKNAGFYRALHASVPQHISALKRVL